MPSYHIYICADSASACVVRNQQGLWRYNYYSCSGILCTTHNFNPYTPHIQRAQNSTTEIVSSTESLDGIIMIMYLAIRRACIWCIVCDFCMVRTTWFQQ